MKKIFFIFGIFFLGNIFFISVHAAQENPFLPDFCEEINKKNEYLNAIQEDMKNEQDFFKALEKTKKAYHEHMNEVFNEHMEKLNDSLLLHKNQDYTEACSFLENEMEDSTSMKKVMEEELQNLEKYKCALFSFQIAPEIFLKSQLLEEGNSELSLASSTVKQEIENSEYAFLTTLEMYSQMRMYYPVHRNLECLIGQLTNYRDALSEFINLVVWIPTKYLNFGTQNPQ